MKTLLTVGLMLTTYAAISQQSVEPLQPVESPTKMHAEYKSTTHSQANQSQSVTISKTPGQPQVVHDVNYYNAQIAKVDAQIMAIEAKVTHVNNTPSEKAIAEQNGWFQQMEQVKLELNQRRTTLVQKRDNL